MISADGYAVSSDIIDVPQFAAGIFSDRDCFAVDTHDSNVWRQYAQNFDFP